jgi:Fuc2NAc and GlcNAc transferase
VLPLLLASAVLGFLPWNWPPARLFMGDVGSGILGFTIGLFTLQASHQAPQLTWSWLILSSVFWVDATLTLLRRLWRSERVWQAHRSHAYQRAAQRIGAHRPVSLGVLAINLVWLAPSATLVAFKLLEGSIGLILAVLPLLVVVIVLARVRPLEG